MDDCARMIVAVNGLDVEISIRLSSANLVREVGGRRSKHGCAALSMGSVERSSRLLASLPVLSRNFSDAYLTSALHPSALG